jgi:hypothetical protein
MSTTPNDAWTLGKAKEWLREKAEAGGERCPCCTQRAQVYRWSLYSTAVRALILFYRIGGTEEFTHSRVLKEHGHTGQGDASRLRYWGLLEEEPARKPDGGRSGFWRVTELGGQFVTGAVTAPKYAYVYDARVLRFDGDRVSVQDALGKNFDYREMMEGQ